MKRSSIILLGLFLALFNFVSAIPFTGPNDIESDYSISNSSHRREASHFIMSGYQTTLYRSGECDISMPEGKTPFQVTVINWIAIYWTYTGAANENMWVAVEAETRGWVGMGFTDSDMGIEGAEVVKGWIIKNDADSSLDQISIGSYRLGKEGWMDTIDNHKKIPIYNTSMCQTSDGRTIMRFMRKAAVGKHPVQPWVGAYGYTVAAVGETDTSETELETAAFSMSPWQGRIGPEEPEGWSFRWILTYLLFIFHAFSWMLH